MVVDCATVGEMVKFKSRVNKSANKLNLKYEGE